MPKMKTSRAAAKRFKVTGTGKLKRKISFAKNEYENVIKTIKIYEYRLKPKEENDDK